MIERIVKAAREQNGWIAKGVVLLDHTSARGVTAIIHFERPSASEELGRYGTAAVFTEPVEDDPAGFEWGHYDMSAGEALLDLTKRIDRGY